MLQRLRSPNHRLSVSKIDTKLEGGSSKVKKLFLKQEKVLSRGEHSTPFLPFHKLFHSFYLHDVPRALVVVVLVMMLLLLVLLLLFLVLVVVMLLLLLLQFRDEHSVSYYQQYDYYACVYRLCTSSQGSEKPGYMHIS